MAISGDVPLTIRTGDDESVTITFSDETTGLPINITGRTYRAQIRSASSSTTILASWTCAVTNGAAGILTLSLTDTRTSTLSPGFAVWDLEETTAGGIVSTPLAGRVSIVQDVTR